MQSIKPMEMKYQFWGAEGVCFSDVTDVSLPAGVRLVMPQQTHTTNVGVVTSPDEQFPETDALITQTPGLAVGVRTADCVPVLLYAPDIRAVAAIHAGWKGTVGMIVAKTIDKLVEMGARPKIMKAAYGPSICGECYETGTDLAEKFIEAGLGEAVKRGRALDPLGEKIFDGSSVRIDLQQANTIIMCRRGIPEANITTCTECTRHAPGGYWPSWRRNPGTASRLATVIFLR